MIDMISFLFSYACECGQMFCKGRIAFTDEFYADFQEYKDQRDSFCLISKSCIGSSKISPERIVVEGNDYWIVEKEK